MRPFDIDEARAELKNTTQNSGGGRKLSFFDRCAAYAALYMGARPSIVAEFFSLSETSVSFIAGCRNDTRAPFTNEIGTPSTDPNLTRDRSPSRKPRYQDVAAEFDRLGELEFIKTYYHSTYRDSIVALQNGPRKQPKPDPAARDCEGVHEIPGGDVWVTVRWIGGADDGGWAWSDCEANGDRGANSWTGRELFDRQEKFKPYRTSKAALDGAKEYWERD